MKTKLETNKYDSPLDGLAADVTQLAKNAHKFNGSQDLVAALASKLESEVHAELNSFRKSLKRKAASSADVDHASPAKNGSSSKSSSMNGGAHPPKKLKRSIPNGH
ncbi:hypothetical protein DL93DRAFT_2069724 [Clavulina sp. PMI_390]|nr:hypothetical protein DL93DRAFT_2069724 [Clavulina sp. PMI_390]